MNKKNANKIILFSPPDISELVIAQAREVMVV